MPTKFCAYWSSSLWDMNRKQKGTESAISLWLRSSFALDGCVCNSCQEITTCRCIAVRQPSIPLRRLSATPMCLAFALLDQQCVSSQGVLEVKLCPCNSKVIGKVSNHRFLDYGFWDINWPKNGSHDVKYSLRELVLLRWKSTQLAVQLHHKGKLYLTCLVVN